MALGSWFGWSGGVLWVEGWDGVFLFLDLEVAFEGGGEGALGVGFLLFFF